MKNDDVKSHKNTYLFKRLVLKSDRENSSKVYFVQHFVYNAIFLVALNFGFSFFQLKFLSHIIFDPKNDQTLQTTEYNGLYGTKVSTNSMHHAHK